MGMLPRPARPLSKRMIQRALAEAPTVELLEAGRKRGLQLLDRQHFAHWVDLSPKQRTMVIDVLTEQAARYRLAESMQILGDHSTALFRADHVAGALRAARLTLEEVVRRSMIWKRQ